MIKPIEIARRLNISTSALRHYEEWGIVPPPKRQPNGYRMYTEEHLAYFECIRAMNAGFGMRLVKQVMPLIQQGNITQALWIVNEAQANMYKEKVRADNTIQALDVEELERFSTLHKKEWYSIGEVAKEIDVPQTTIRHWEKEGLVEPSRNLENGYRQYNRADLRRLLIIRTLRSAVYSLEVVGEVLDEIDQHSISHAKKIASDALQHMDYIIQQQLRAGIICINYVSLYKRKILHKNWGHPL